MIHPNAFIFRLYPKLIYYSRHFLYCLPADPGGYHPHAVLRPDASRFGIPASPVKMPRRRDSIPLSSHRIPHGGDPEDFLRLQEGGIAATPKDPPCKGPDMENDMAKT